MTGMAGIIGGVFGAGIAYTIVAYVRELRRRELERSIMDSFSLLAGELAQGRAIEAAMSALSKTGQPSSRAYKDILKRVSSGRSVSVAVAETAKTIGSQSLMMLSDIIPTDDPSRGDIIGPLRRLGKRLNEIAILDEEVESKLSYPVTVIRFTGIILLPIFYLIISHVLNGDAGASALDRSIQHYLLAVNLLMVMLPYFIFGRIKASLDVLPLSVTYFLFLMLVLGDKLISLVL